MMRAAHWICLVMWGVCGAACSGHGEGPYALFTVKERGERYENVYRIEKYDEASEDGQCATHRDELRMGQLIGSESGGHFVEFDAEELEALMNDLNKLSNSSHSDQSTKIEVIRYQDSFNIRDVIELNLDNTEHARFLEQVKQLCRKRWPAPTSL